jgi:hypothetical protein
MSTQDNYFIQKQGDIFVTTKFWTCNCGKENIHPERMADCPRCGAREEDAPLANVAEIMEHAEELKDCDADGVMAVYNSILSADKAGPDDVYCADIFHAIANHHGYSNEADTGILYRVIIEDVVQMLTQMLDSHELGMGMLTGDKFPDLLQYIENDLWFDVENAVRFAIRGWLENEKQKDREAEEAKRQHLDTVIEADRRNAFVKALGQSS